MQGCQALTCRKPAGREEATEVHSMAGSGLAGMAELNHDRQGVRLKPLVDVYSCR